MGMWRRLEAYTGLRCVRPLAFRCSRSWHWFPDIMQAPLEATTIGGRYRKLMAVLKHVECELQPGCPASLHAAVERFAMGSEGQWLKVAGGEKAGLLSAVVASSPVGGGAVALECGAFIGYSAARLSAAALETSRSEWKVGPSVLSVEGDPIHAAIARHFLDRVHVAYIAEILSGMVRDVLPCVGE